ncbi:MAG: hypothetical protein JSW58_07380, partial [Candidatus Latescibacterota bacterium]
TADILGYPEVVQYFRKGQTLPNGEKAKAEGHWVEGYLLDTEKADEIWELGKALQKTNRRLGYSVEGKIQKRTGPGNRTIARALVRNVAITNCPVHQDARMEILAKSLHAVEESEPEPLEKMLGMGTPADGQVPTGPVSGMGAGMVLTEESLESDVTPTTEDKKKKKKKRVQKGFSDSQAFAWFQRRLPKANPAQIGRMIDLTRRLKEAGKLS